MTAMKTVFLLCFTYLYVFIVCTAFAAPKNAIAVETAPFFEAPESGLLARGFIDKRDTCAVDSTVVDSTGTAWFHVRSLRALRAGRDGKSEGWVLSKAVTYISDIPADFASREARGDEDKKRRLEILKSRPEWPRRIIKAVRSGQICLDMTVEQVVASWGEPAEKRKSFMIGVGDYQTLLYNKGGGKGTLIVTLQNNRVIGWTTDE
jgi:hypothetical protein